MNTPWELQDTENDPECDVRLVPGESFNCIGFASIVVLIGFLVVLWTIS